MMAGKVSFLLSVALLVLALLPAWGSTWYVDGSVSASGNGKAWATAFKKIQEGIDAASHGDTVIVAQGTYVENVKFNGKNIVLTSTDPLDPAIVASTIIDGNKAGSVVTFTARENETCVLSGFTVRNGRAPDGGGVRGQAWWSRGATIRNNLITENEGLYEGGGLYGCNGTIENNTILGNSAGLQGGGLYYCNGTIQNNTIAGNSANIGGGLTYCDGVIQNNTITGNSASAGAGVGLCNGIIQNNTITGNSAGAGGALYKCDGTVQNNRVAGNSASHDGGGLHDCDGTIRNNTIAGNSATLNGGGLHGCDGIIRNNTVTGNSAVGEGGGLESCQGTIENNTITGNSAGRLGGGLGWCHKTIRNCIIWGNAAPQGAQLHGSATPIYCCIEDWSGGGEGNIADNPQFVDADGPDDLPETHEDNDYRLRADSPCIDAGKNEDWMWSSVDLDGNPRIFYGRSSQTVDMGVYEYGSWPFKIVGISLGSNDEGQITWSSRPGDTYTVWSCAGLSAGGWVEEASVASQGENTSWTDASPLGQQKFYRIEMK
ncbi:MAG: right-handed parallel beta-helix repeat-containing protein [bacterium]|nr:right-handed parallel beta-helix repeat-containing protein [bacterium]